MVYRFCGEMNGKGFLRGECRGWRLGREERREEREQSADSSERERREAEEGGNAAPRVNTMLDLFPLTADAR